MEHNIFSYRVEIKNLKFVTDDGRRFPKTAIITFLDSQGDEARTELLGNLDVNDVYSIIEEEKPLNLDNCFIQDFSLSFYRKHHGCDKKSLVKLNSFSARNAFFEARQETDFSFADFGDGEISFEGAFFASDRVNFQNCRFGEGDIIFSGINVAEGNIDFSGTDTGSGDFIFKNAVVGDGTKDFQDMKFHDGDISFANTEFNSGEVLFINSNFGEGKFTFKIARINSGRVDFHYSVFGAGDVSFERVEFGNSRVDFRAVDFGEGRVNFNRSVFGEGDVTFEGASSRGSKFYFRRVSMQKGIKDFSLMEMPDADLSFEKTVFSAGDLIFNTSRCRVLSLRSCHLDHYVDLRLAGAELIDLSDSIVRDIIDMEPFNADVKVDSVNISGMRLLGKLYVDWKKNNLKEAILGQDYNSLMQKAEQFRILKENFNDTGRYDDEDLAYVMFKRLEAKAGLEELREKRKGPAYIAGYISYLVRWLIFDAAGQYATNPVRVLFSMMVSYFFFSLVYLFQMLFTSADIIASVDDRLSVGVKAFYHSAITFLTIGYGDHFPSGSIRWMSGIEGFVGLFLMSYFTVAFVRKILR